MQSDDDGPPTTSGALELQTPGSKSKSSPATLVDSSVVVADCASCCLPLPFLNRFRSPKWFLVFLSVAATVQGVCVNGLVNVVITSIERRFHLQSTQSGIIASSYDIGSLIVMIPVSYYPHFFFWRMTARCAYILSIFINIETSSDCHPESEFSLLVSAHLWLGMANIRHDNTPPLLCILTQPELISQGELPWWQIGHL